MPYSLLTNSLAKEGLSNILEISRWSAQNGFQALEVGPTVPLSFEECAKAKAETGVTIEALTYCRNFLSTDEDEANAHIAELKRRIGLAGELGIGLIVTSTGIDKTLEEGVYDRADSIRRIPERSLDKVARIFTPIIQLAEKNSVKIAFENCPLMGNIAISPDMWAKLFAVLDSKNVGLTFDPSHLHWQFINPYTALNDFADKIFHFHAKDTVIYKEKLEKSGFLTDFKWWEYKIPGDGELDWKKLMEILKISNYKGLISIEHEDAAWEGSLKLVQDGLIKSREYLENIELGREE